MHNELLYSTIGESIPIRHAFPNIVERFLIKLKKFYYKSKPSKGLFIGSNPLDPCLLNPTPNQKLSYLEKHVLQT
jgi:hypothetical protein